MGYYYYLFVHKHGTENKHINVESDIINQCVFVR